MSFCISFTHKDRKREEWVDLIREYIDVKSRIHRMEHIPREREDKMEEEQLLEALLHALTKTEESSID